jgi:hypothetical protein
VKPFQKIISFKRIQRLCPALLVLGFMTGPAQAPAAEAPPPPPTTAALTEYEIKAGYLYNFAKLTEWPPESFPDSNAPFVLGILGEDPFGGALDSLAGEPVKERKLAVKKFSSLSEVKDCHLLFISSSEKNNLARILEALKNKSVLTVSEAGSFLEMGGIIYFTTEESKPGKIKVRFKVNLTAAKQAKLKISSQLLKVAAEIRTAEARGAIRD